MTCVYVTLSWELRTMQGASFCIFRFPTLTYTSYRLALQKLKVPYNAL